MHLVIMNRMEKRVGCATGASGGETWQRLNLGAPQL